MAGATSLVQLILKKWGDDIAGAAKELEEKVGFPESVANRIASGELPMDPASVEARRIAQGYGDELYHGSTHDILEFNGQGNPSNDWGQGTYLSDSTHDVSRNYAGTHGEDFKNRVEMEERQADLEYGGEQYAHDQAVARLKGENDGVIYPVRVKQDGLFNVHDEIELPDYNRQAADELGYDYDKYVNEEYDEDVLFEIEERASDLQYEDYDSPNQNLFGVGNEYNADMSNVYGIEEGDTWQDVRGRLKDVYAEDEAGNYVGSGAFAGEVMSRSGAKGVYDPSAAERFPSMESGEHTIIFPGSENQIRSVNAAFDPQYTGSNIMGGLALPVAAGLLAAGQSEDADAGFITKGGKTLLEAWHGSPHKFDKFSMDAIGTGEGAQAYGHGLYFADSEDVAKQYRDSLSGAQLSDGKPVLPSWDDPRFMPLQVLNKNNFDVDAARKEVVSRAEQGNWLEQIDAFDEMVANGVRGNLGHLYRTEIDVTPESLLDWDAMLDEQPKAVQEAIESTDWWDYAADDLWNGADNPTGGSLVRWLSDDGPEFGSQQLNDAGIKGIKYLDGDSRAVGDGTSNYVIFDDSLINIAERGNATVPMLATTAGLSSAGLLAPMIKDSGMISAPRSETLFDLTMGARDLERRLEGSPASLLFPSGLVEYLETVNRREEDPNAMTRGMALLDVLPF